MDALARLEPVARPLMLQVDEALGTLGAPAEHEVWSLLRRIGATPADTVTFFAALSGTGSQIRAAEQPDQVSALRLTAQRLRERAHALSAVVVPAQVPWSGGAGQAYTARAVAIAGHLHGHPGGGDESLTGRLSATASYVDEIADWQGRSRDRIARALAATLSSGEAVTMRAAAARGPASASTPGEFRAPEILAAAEIGAHVLTAAADALSDGHDVRRAWAHRLTELPYRSQSDHGPTRFDATIRLTH